MTLTASRLFRLLLFALALCQGAACNSPESGETSGKIASQAEKLEGITDVNLVVLPESMNSLSEALTEKGYGSVVESDYKPEYMYKTADVDGRAIKAIVAYSGASAIEKGAVFRPVGLLQGLTAASRDAEGQGITIFVGGSGQEQSWVTIPKEDLSTVVKDLKESGQAYQHRNLMIYTMMDEGPVPMIKAP